MEKIELHCEEYGKGRPVILLHGLFGAGWHWTKIVHSLSRDYKVYVPDLRNHGSSPCSRNIDYASMAEDIVQVINSRKIEEATLVGHSMGGKVALAIAARYPSLVRKIVVADIAHRSYAPRYSEILKELWKLTLHQLTRKSTFQRNKIMLYNEIYDHVVEIFLRKNFPGKAAALSWFIKFPLLIRWYRHILKGIDLPVGFDKQVLFLKSSLSGYITDRDKEQIQRIFKRARIVTVHNAGHWLHIEAPDIMIREIRNFCEE